jgi:hypothetical protein
MRFSKYSKQKKHVALDREINPARRYSRLSKSRIRAMSAEILFFNTSNSRTTSGGNRH